jgi:hypothetical protein
MSVYRIGGNDSSPKGVATQDTLISAYSRILKRWANSESLYPQLTDEPASETMRKYSNGAIRAHSRQQLVLSEGMNTLATHAPRVDTGNTNNVQVSQSGGLETPQTTSFFGHLPSSQELHSWAPSDRILVVWDNYNVPLTMEEIKMQLSGSEFWSQFAMKVYKAGSERPQDLDIDNNIACLSHPPFFNGHAVCSPDSRPILHLNDGGSGGVECFMEGTENSRLGRSQDRPEQGHLLSPYEIGKLAWPRGSW